MKVAITGFARSGKTTIFNALTGQHADVGGFTEPGKVHLGTIKVPDPRLDRLSEVYRPRKTTHAELVFTDLPAAAERDAGGALETGMLAHMREADALVQVIRGFPDPLAGDAPDPLHDRANFKSELLLADLVVIEKRLERLQKEGRKDREQTLLERCKATLDAECPLRCLDVAAAETGTLSGFGFVSLLPLMVVLNVGEAEVRSEMPAPLAAALTADGVEGLVLSGKIEMEIAALDAADRQAFLDDLGLKASARERFIRAAYELLDQVSFLTTSDEEVRAWTIKRGTTALEAAGKVHSDMQRGFIRAEVVHFEDFVRYGGEGKCREAGKLRLEGKDYPVKDGDIIRFRFNV